MKKIFFAIIILLINIQNSFGQLQGKVYQEANYARVLNNNVLLNCPWVGGFNCLQITQGDLNNDGKQDIVAYDYINNKIFPFLFSSSTGKYEYAPKFIASFPAINNYLILKDYNKDGIPDLFHKGLGGFNVSKGKYVNNKIQFTYYKELYFPGFPLPINAYVQPTDIPSIVDMDGDGDLDFAAFDIFGTTMQYFKNMAIENKLPLDSIQLVLGSSCWGKIIQSSVNKTYVLNAVCKGFEPNEFISPILDIDTNWQSGYPNFNYIPGAKKTRHAGNCQVHFDADNDGDMDLMIGSISNNDVQLLENTGTSTNALIGNQDSIWNEGNGTPMYCPQFVAPHAQDIDNDGDLDLLFSPHQESDNKYSFHNDKLFYYQNNPINGLNSYSLKSDSLLFENTIDLGSYSYPTFYDYDKDGKKDLFVGSAGVLDTTDFKWKASIYYFKNTSTTNNIQFTLITKNFLGLAQKKYLGLYPHFADITGDGKDDLLMGDNKGHIIVYKNIAASNTVAPNLVWQTDSFQNIKIPGEYCAPIMFDVNFDGKKDIVCGSQSGQLFYFEDTTTVANNPSAFYYLTGTLGVLSAGGNNFNYGYSAPIYTQVDSFKKWELVIGTADGTLERYNDVQTNIYGPYTLIDSFYSSIQTLERATPAIADLDNDGDNEMIVGNKLGGLQFYQQVLHVNSNDTILIDTTFLTVKITDVQKQQNTFMLYPNPANDVLYIENKLEKPFTIYIYNTNGAIVAQQKTNMHKTSIATSQLSAGLYVYKIVSQHQVQMGNILVAK